MAIHNSRCARVFVRLLISLVCLSSFLCLSTLGQPVVAEPPPVEENDAIDEVAALAKDEASAPAAADAAAKESAVKKAEPEKAQVAAAAAKVQAAAVAADAAADVPAETVSKPDFGRADELAKPLLVPRTSTWKYWDAETPPDADWSQPNFDDGAWSSGKAPLGYGDGEISTTISFGADRNNKYPVAFFRLRFQVTKDQATKPAIGHMMNDDGAIVYLNGKEIYRRNLPRGDVDGEFASTSSKPEHYWWTMAIPPAALRVGENCLAVRVHQRSGDSSDLIHVMELESCDAQSAAVARRLQREEQVLFTGYDIGKKPVIDWDAEWKYFTETKAPAEWPHVEFDDSAWTSAQTRLGYGEGEGNLTTSLEGEPQVIRLRHAFELTEAQAKNALVGQVQFDDGAAIYINGKEIGRYLLPEGELNGEIPATAKISDENHLWTFLLEPKQLKVGKNVIALSVHQQKGSGDMSTQMQLIPSNDETAALASKVQQAETGGNLAPRLKFVPSLIAKESEWHYWDKKDPPPKKWNQLDFDDSKWSQAKGPLGYGDDFVASEIQAREDEKQEGNNQAAYFRREFEAPELVALRGAMGHTMHDDGVIVYINGLEVYRRNLIEKFDINADYATISAKKIEEAGEDETPYENGVQNAFGTVTYASGSYENHYWTFAIPQGVIRPGKNVVAIRVQQCNAGSSDLAMDFELVSVSRTELIANARIQAKEAVGDIKFAAQPVEQLVQTANRASMTHLSDGESTYSTNNQRYTVVYDALVQAEQYAPGAKFARAMEGDTLKKLAVREGLDYEKLLILNRTKKNKTLKHREIYLQSWEYQLSSNDTWDSLATLFGTTEKDLLDLNDLAADAKPASGQKIQIPGKFQYHWQPRSSYMLLAMYQGRTRISNTPYDTRSMKSKIHTVKKDETLDSIAKKYNVSTDFLRIMNGLEPDEELGDRILIEYSAKVLKGKKLEDIARLFRIEMDDMLAANGLENAEDMKPEQRVQIPYGERMGLNRRSTDPNSFVVYEVVLGSGKFQKATDRRRVRPTQPTKKTDAGPNNAGPNNAAANKAAKKLAPPSLVVVEGGEAAAAPDPPAPPPAALDK